MGRWRFIWAALVTLFITTGAANAQVTQVLSNLPEGEILPGKTQTIVLNLTNQTNDTLDLRLDLDIPKPLRALIFNKKVTLMPNKSQPILVPISIPRATTSGNYALTFGVTLNGKRITSQKTTFAIAKITDVKVELIEYPSYARSIDTIRARFMIMNNGNSTEVLTLVSKNGIIKAKNSQAIPADSTIFIDMWILNDPKTYEVEDQLIDLFCNIADINQSVGDQEIIKVYPARTVKVDPFFRYPINVNASYFTQNTNGEYYNSILQYQISGKGPLDVDKVHNLNFAYRGPGAVRITRIGNFSQKFVHYNSRKTNVFIGEKTYGLSELTENFRFGTGIEFNTTIQNKVSFGGYYNRPIFQPEIREQFGSFIAFHTPKQYKFRINSLNNYLREGQTINLTSFQVDLTNYTDWRFNAEVSRSFSEGEDGNAAAYNTNININKFRISSNGLYADKNFKGYYNNSLNLGLNASYSFEKISFQVNGNYSNSNPNLDTVFSVAPISFFMSTGFLSRISKAFDIQFLGVYREKTDRLASKNFDYTEKRLRLTMGFKRGKFSSRFLTEAGNTTNKLAVGNETSFGYDAQLQLSYRPRPNFWLSSFSQYLNNNRFSTETERYLLYGVDANIRYGKKFTMTCEFQNNFLIEDLYNDRNLLNFKMGYEITPKQTIQATANYGILHQAPVRRDWFLSANYNLRLGVPMVRTMALGSLEGRLVNGGVNSVDNVVLMLDGQLITTNSDGSFSFNNVRPGVHQLYIDRATIGVRDLPDQKLPLEVEVFAEKTTKVSITMTRSAKVTGKITMEKVRMTQSSKGELKFPSIIVEASMGDESLLTRADADGNFVFGSLRPGTWKIRMVPTYWKDDFVIKTPYIQLDLEAGQDETVDMTITPKVRQIQFFNQGTRLKVGGK